MVRSPRGTDCACLGGWLVGCMLSSDCSVGWWVGRLVGRWVSGLHVVCLLFSWLVGRHSVVGGLVGWLVVRLGGWLVGCMLSAGCSICWSFGWVVG